LRPGGLHVDDSRAALLDELGPVAVQKRTPVS
jgi:hypothetical protein